LDTEATTSDAVDANVVSVGIIASAFDTDAAISEEVAANVVAVIGIVIAGVGETYVAVLGNVVTVN
jgi:hypothetical protein